jgi:hypothetical protein
MAMRIVRHADAGRDDNPDGDRDSAGAVRLARIGQPGQSGDILSGCDVGPDGHLLSVAELQVAYREFYARKHATEADESIAPGDTKPADLPGTEPATSEAGATGSPSPNVETANPAPMAAGDTEISPAALALAEALNKRAQARSA